MTQLYEILEYFKLKKSGYINQKIEKPSSILPGKKNSLSFIDKEDNEIEKKIKKTRSLIILISKKIRIKNSKKILIKLENPKIEFCKILELFFAEKKKNIIQSSCFIDREAILSKNIHIDSFSYVGKAKIGKNVIIRPNVTIHDNVEIGDNSEIGSGSVIGSEGFGFPRKQDLEIIKFPQIGGVKIGKNVRVGSNNSIDRGTLENTIINDDVKIDNNVHIAHNCIIDKRTLITAGVIFSGSVRVGKNVWIGTGTVIKDQVYIGDNALIGVGSVVINNVEKNDIVFGVPAKKKKL